MDNPVFPDDKELKFRNTYYRNVIDVLDGDILCGICNSDIKKAILLNENIMIHENFLCLCCNNCFEKLSNLRNGCIFCSQKIQLQICGVCNSNMCQRCIDNYYCCKLEHLKRLENCLKCSTNKLWKQRSQAAAVLKCFSFELDLRLTLSGRESDNQKIVRKFVINAAKCDNNITPSNIHQMRVKYLYQLLNSKIKLAFDEYLKFNIKVHDIKQCIEQFTTLCEEVLKNTCATLLDFKCLFNDEIIESLDLKVKTILKNSILFQKNENSTKKTQKVKSLNDIKTQLFDLKSSNVLSPNCSFSLEKQNENIKDDRISSMVVDKRVKKNCTEIYSGSKVLNLILTRFDEKVNENATNTEKKLVVEANNRISQSNAIVFSADEKIALVPKVILTRIDEKDNDNDINNGKKFVGETANTNTGSSIQFHSASKGCTKALKISLPRLDMKDINNVIGIKSEGEKNQKHSEENVNAKSTNIIRNKKYKEKLISEPTPSKYKDLKKKTKKYRETDSDSKKYVDLKPTRVIQKRKCNDKVTYSNKKLLLKK